MKKVVVTGCAGYIGSVLTQYLLGAGYHVVGVDNLMYRNWSALLPYLGHPRFEFHRLHAADTSTLSVLTEEANGIILLAALVGAPACERNPQSAWEINHRAILDIIKEMKPWQRVIYPNTNSGYGETDGGRYCTEEDPLAPISVYGESKCAAEREVLRHPLGIAFRLATVFGASPRMRMDLMVNDFTAKILQAKDNACDIDFMEDSRFSIFEPNFKRNFVHVRDVARVMTHALENTTLRGVYNLGLPTANLTKMELAHRVCDVLGVSREIVTVGSGKDPDRRNYLVSNDKILNAGFVFRHGLEEGIREVAQICRLFPANERKTMRNV